MRRVVILSFLFSIFHGLAFSQTTVNPISKRNGFYAEAYLIRHDFSEGFVSINYERNVGKKSKTNLRLGLYPDFQSTVSFPITISWMTNPLSQHHFEYGLGVMFRIEHFVDPYGYTSRSWFYDVPAIMFPVMYRFQAESGWFFRGGINLFVSWPTLPSPSFSVGYRL